MVKNAPKKKPAAKRKQAATDKQRAFAYACVCGGNATQAYVDVYRPAASVPRWQCCERAYRLRQRPAVREAMAHFRETAAEEAHAEAHQVLREFAVVAFSDIASILEALGAPDEPVTLSSLARLSPEQRRSIRVLRTRPSEYGPITEVQLHDKTKALDSLARTLGLYEADNEQVASPVRELIEAIRANGGSLPGDE